MARNCFHCRNMWRITRTEWGRLQPYKHCFCVAAFNNSTQSCQCHDQYSMDACSQARSIMCRGVSAVLVLRVVPSLYSDLVQANTLKKGTTRASYLHGLCSTTASGGEKQPHARLMLHPAQQKGRLPSMGNSYSRNPVCRN